MLNRSKLVDKQNIKHIIGSYAEKRIAGKENRRKLKQNTYPHCIIAEIIFQFPTTKITTRLCRMVMH